MRTSFSLSDLSKDNIVIFKDQLWLKRQKHAGRCIVNILNAIGKLIEDHTEALNLLYLEELAFKYMNLYDCSPTFFNYPGNNKNPFPGKICISVNNELVHGIPRDYVLQDGDVVSIDLGATFEGAIADAARTWIYGTPKSPEHTRMLNICSEALKKAINSIEIGKRLGCIGNAIHQYTKNSGFNLICNYGGHGINYNKPHADPFVCNKAQLDEGIRIQPGLSIAIEPMLVMGDTKTKVLSDGWTVVTSGIGCHFENSVTVMEDGVHIITE